MWHDDWCNWKNNWISSNRIIFYSRSPALRLTPLNSNSTHARYSTIKIFSIYKPFNPITLRRHCPVVSQSYYYYFSLRSTISIAKLFKNFIFHSRAQPLMKIQFINGQNWWRLANTKNNNAGRSLSYNCDVFVFQKSLRRY